MGKRIFTREFHGNVTIDAAVGPPGGFVNAKTPHSWLLQESIEVIGASITVATAVPSENDGYSLCIVELSQAGLYGADGSILKAEASEGWNTTPAGIALSGANIAVMFPQGATVPVREEGYLYINAGGIGKSAGECVYYFSVIVHYTKKGNQ